jgi:hypothetical protein
VNDVFVVGIMSRKINKKVGVNFFYSGKAKKDENRRYNPKRGCAAA